MYISRYFYVYVVFMIKIFAGERQEVLGSCIWPVQQKTHESAAVIFKMGVGPMYPHFSLGIPTRDFILLLQKKECECK